jgi:hypothetical protein
MQSHELARQLLTLPDKPVLVVQASGEGTVDHIIHPGGPWEDRMGMIRLQVEPEPLIVEDRHP